MLKNIGKIRKVKDDRSQWNGHFAAEKGVFVPLTKEVREECEITLSKERKRTMIRESLCGNRRTNNRY